MEFDHFETFFGSERSSVMEIGSFRVESKTFVMKGFACNRAILGMERQWAEWDKSQENIVIHQTPYSYE